MKIKSVVLLILLSLLVVGCTNDVYRDEKNTDTKSMFVEVENTMRFTVYYHRDTKVMYVQSKYGSGSGDFEPLINPDGTPMLWESEDTKEKEHD